MSFSFAVNRLSLGRAFERIIALFELIVLIQASFAPSAYATAVGATPGSHQVSPSGAFTYTIPIAVPPGTAGIEPKPSLSYNSQGANGLLGMGWSLAGLSVIHRCPKTMVQDGVIGSVNYNANDRYCLDGQRLIAITGAYGADGTEYRTESESYSRIVSYGSQGTGPASWKVWTKSGRILEYGNTADSRIEAQGKASVMVWALDKVQDTVGNYFTVSYTEDNANGQYYPSRIDYTGNTNTALAPYNSVQFVYEARPDITPLYQAGSLIKNTVRMTKVQTYSSATLTREYRLSYTANPINGVSMVKDLTECESSNGTCLQPSFIVWKSQSDSSFNEISWPVPNNSIWDANRVWLGDYNGDGRTDLLSYYNGTFVTFFSQGDGTYVEVPWTGSNNSIWDSGHAWAGDFNGDGKTDLLSFYNGSMVTFVSQGDGTYKQISWPVPNNSIWDANRVWLGDYNGDGRTDLLSYYNGTFVTFFSQGDGTYVEVPWTGSNNSIWDSGHAWAGDFNGDGKTDLLSFYNGSMVTFVSQGDGTYKQISWPVPNNSIWDANHAWAGDFNGDGRGSLLSFYSGSFVTFIPFANPPVATMASITIGLNATTAITYKPLTYSSVYAKDTTAVYPYVDVQAPLYVVSSVATSDGLGGNHVTDYTYAGAKSHLLGGGFLGFRQVTTHDPQAHISTTTTYRQDYPYQGQPLSTQKLTDSGILLGQSLITYSDQLLNTGISPTWHQSLPTHTVESSYELTGGLISTVVTDTQYDVWGNPTSIAVDAGGGSSKTTTHTYDNIIDANRWFLGRLRRSTVTSVTP
jgi:hypothetical protein